MVTVLGEPVNDDHGLGQTEKAAVGERTLREPLLSPMLRNFVLVPEISCREDNLYHGDQQMPQTRAISPGKRAVKHLSAHHWKEGLTAGQEKNVH